MKEMTNKQYRNFLDNEVQELNLRPIQSQTKVEWVNQDGEVIVRSVCRGGRDFGYTFVAFDLREK
jgi:hypothetical protein